MMSVKSCIDLGLSLSDISSGDETFVIYTYEIQKRKGLKAVLHLNRATQAVLSRSTDGSYYPRMDVEGLESQVTHHHRVFYHKDSHRPQRPKKIVKSIWVKKGSTVGSQAVLPQTVKKSAMISPKQTWRPKGKYLDLGIGGLIALKLFVQGNPERDSQGDYAIIAVDVWKFWKETRTKLSNFKEFKGGYVPWKRTLKVKESQEKEPSRHHKECLILSPQFKFVDEDLVILRAPRKNDVYSLDLKNIIPSGGIRVWLPRHRGMKLVLGTEDWGMSLQKYQQVGLKAILESVNRKKYCLVVTDDCPANSLGIKREYSIARTPQQNGVAERKNRTLIEAARTISAYCLSGNLLQKKLNYLSFEDHALHDELVSLMHQESLAKAHNDDQRIAFEEEKRRISIAKGKEHVDSTFTLSTANTPPQSTGNTPTDSDDDTPKMEFFYKLFLMLMEGGVADFNTLGFYH
ncbi:putative ribonuclease H-like domain-containing protein [Tanacetum coccineum]